MRPDLVRKKIKATLEIDPVKTERKLVGFIRGKVKESSANGVVVGISGGIDSAVVASLSVRALGKKKVLGLALPQVGVTPESDIRDSKNIAKGLGIELRYIDIAPILRSIEKSVGVSNKSAPLAMANLKPRTRMIIIYYHANNRNRIVAGTGNKSELRAGYFTKYGDGGVDILPIGGLYKTQVRSLAKHLGVHHEIIKKIPTAGLWKGQTDEGELGITYANLDMIYAGLDLGFSVKEISGAVGESIEKVEEFIKREKQISHKLKMPEIAEI